MVLLIPFIGKCKDRETIHQSHQHEWQNSQTSNTISTKNGGKKGFLPGYILLFKNQKKSQSIKLIPISEFDMVPIPKIICSQ